MNERMLHVRALWDPDAEVWIAESDDVPGLVAEEATFDALVKTVVELVPELLQLNNAAPADRDCVVSVTTERIEPVRLPA